jgi:aryl-alcohol dehydrogenase-like predicted oxidoreductase
VITYFSLASGFLSGKYRSKADLAKSPRGGSVGKFLNERGERIIQALEQVANTHKAGMASVAVAWLLARESVTAPIASATSLDQLQSLIAATELKLGHAAMEQLDKASAY